MAKGKRYNIEFRLGAARMVVDQGFSQSEAARKLGVTPTTIKTWIDQFRRSGELPPADQPVPEADELRRLRQEIRRLQMENDSLKKATAYFAKDAL